MKRNRTTTFVIGCVCGLAMITAGLTSGLAQPAGGKKVVDGSLVPKVRFTKGQFEDLVVEMII